MEAEEIQEIFKKIRQSQPVIHMIPNTVSAALCADGLSALGARPLMAVAPQEMEEIVAQADSIVVNLGQLTQEKKAAARTVLETAGKIEKPVVLDPVGCGASKFRLEAVQELLQISWKGMIKGNQSEIYSIQQGILTREGIDSKTERTWNTAVLKDKIYLISGKADRILWEDGMQELWKKQERTRNIVGTGCLLGALAGACYSVEPNACKAARAAAVGMAYGLEQAEGVKGYGQAKQALLNAMEQLDKEVFKEWVKEK